MDNVINQVKKNKKIYRTLSMLMALLLNATVFNVFLLPIKLVIGGSNGIATISKYLYHIDPPITIFLISIACVILSFIYLGKERTLGTTLASIAYPILVKITQPVALFIPINTEDIFIVIIFAGVLSGVANGIMYKTGYSNGGFPVINQILYEYLKIPIAKSSFVLNGIIIGIGAIFFGTTNAVYAIILLYINSLILDKVLLGVSNNKAFYIITSEEEQITDYIIKNLKHSITIFDVKGGFLDKKRKVILTVIPSREYYKVTEGIKLLDKDAFFVATDAYQVEGAK